MAQGQGDAQANLGSMHCLRRGRAVTEDLAEARRLFGLAAAQGHAGAQLLFYCLGEMHHGGEAGPQMKSTLGRHQICELRLGD